MFGEFVRLRHIGRLVLPKELRDTMDLPEGTPMAIYTEGEKIIISKYEPGCTFCGEIPAPVEYKGKIYAMTA